MEVLSSCLCSERSLGLLEQAGLVVWGSSHLGISPQWVEQLLWCLVTLASSLLPETRSNLIEGPAFGLGNFEVGEDEEQNQKHSEDDEDVGTTQLLHILEAHAHNEI